MKRTLISLLVAGLFAAPATTLLAQNVTADDAVTTPKAGDNVQKEMTNPSPEAQSTQPDATSMKQRSDAFEKADKNRSGTLSKSEAKNMPGLSKNFKAIDTDKDGTLSMAEVDAYLDTGAKTSIK